MAVRSHAALFFIDYTLAPEAQYPVQNEQSYAALVHIARNAALLNVDAGSIVVVGDGSGATMAVTLALHALLRKGPAIRLQVLLYPIGGDVSDSPSYRCFSQMPTLSAADVAYFFAYYFPDSRARRHSDALPLNASVEQLTGLPETIIVAGEYDILRDDGEMLADRLLQANVPVSYICYRGVPHGFLTLDALSQTPTACAALEQISVSLRSSLHAPTSPAS